MSFFDNLKQLFNFQFDFSKLSNFKIISDNKINNTIYVDKKTIVLNIAKVEAEKLPNLVKILKEGVLEEDHLLIEESANNTLAEISESEKDQENINILEFFKGKISNNDLEILRASLFVKSVYDKGISVAKLKDDITLRYGDRGRHIVNLCTAGYFTTVIKPLYEVMVETPQFSPVGFMEAFDSIVSESPFAIFVSSQIPLQDLINEVKAKIELNKQYGIDYLYIHGIGEHNVEKITSLLSEIKENFTYQPDVEFGKRYIRVTIYF